jgi:hypothetical protein
MFIEFGGAVENCPKDGSRRLASGVFYFSALTGYANQRENQVFRR